jgi:hypothetical protein
MLNRAAGAGGGGYYSAIDQCNMLGALRDALSDSP